MEQIVKFCYLKGKIEIPASKSDSQRAILAAALSAQSSHIENPGNSDDVLSMIGAVNRLGASTRFHGETLIVDTIELSEERVEIYVGESGLALRLLVNVCAALGGEYHFTGKGTLNAREHRFFEDHLSGHGVTIESDQGKLPLVVKGQLKGGDYVVDGSQSSQYISGLLMALPLLKEDSVLKVKDLRSGPYVRMTLKTLEMFGISILRPDEETFIIKGNQRYSATSYYVEADWSSASYWITAAAIGHELHILGLNTQSRQADRRMLEALDAANCSYCFEHDVLKIEGQNKKAFRFDAGECPDLFPALVVLAAHCNGESILLGVERLKNKESDRGLTLLEEFTKLGLKIHIEGNEMHVFGGLPMHGGALDSHGDHRIAMSLAIAATRIETQVTIEGAESVGKSYPDFWKDLYKLTQ